MSDFAWSHQQQHIFDAVESGSGHLVIEALAGTGKTTTIVEAVCHTPENSSVLVLAFNKAIQREIAPRLPADVDCMTSHSFGLRAVSAALGSPEIDGDRARKLAQELFGKAWSMRAKRTAICKLASLAKATLRADSESLDEMLDDYSIGCEESERYEVITGAQRLLQRCADRPTSIDFDDMLWLPAVLDIATPTYDFVFVDEAQDLNNAQLRLVRKAIKRQGRIVMVGDRHQAIYAFRGAGANVIPEMVAELEATVLPLSITYRCSKVVVREACKLVPGFTAADSAPEGELRHVSEDTLLELAAPGDFVLSRLNAPLVSLCLKWLGEGRRASIAGRDIGTGLMKFVTDSGAATVEVLRECVQSWRVAEVSRLQADDRDITPANDRADCLIALCAGAASVKDVRDRIAELFDTNTQEPGIMLSSAHRAKGLEADRVWLLRDTFCRWVGDEENNLLYVAITRAKKELIYVEGEANE